MVTKTDEALERLETGQEALTTAVAAQGQVLRSIHEQLALLLERLTPKITDGPTLQELLAELVGRVGDNGALLRRIARRTESMEMSLPDDVVRAMKGGDGANGNSSANHGANGSEPA
jgi:hypothetical protein